MAKKIKKMISEVEMPKMLIADTKHPSRLEMEHTNRVIKKIVEKRGFKSIEEANEFVRENIVGRKHEDLMAELGDDPVEEAQELAYFALSAEDRVEALFAATKALDFDPDCIDALLVLASLVPAPDDERVEMLANLVKMAERLLGKECFKEDRGHFWEIIETRPYMRAREALIDFLVEAGRNEEAIEHCEAMIVLNPNDNQGIRDTLLGLYLEKSDLKAAQKLIKKYPSTRFAVFNWGQVLERFLSGNTVAALAALRIAHTNNPYVRDLLTGNKRRSRYLVDSYMLGDKDEAQVVYDEIGRAWKKHPEAVMWLKIQI